MPVVYDSKKIIPAPFIAISKKTNRDDSGKPLGQTYQITVHGKLTAEKGSPNSSGVFWTASGYPADESIAADSRLTAILKKQAALRELFSVEGKTFEVQGYDGMLPFKCNPRIEEISFPDGEGKGANWTEYSEYIITMEADCVSGLSGDDCGPGTHVLKTSNEWNIETIDEDKGTYRLTHSLSATGKRHYDETGALEREAWEAARDWVLNANGDGPGLGLVPARMVADGVLNASDLQAFNYLRSQSLNECTGVFSVTESWVCFDPKGEPPAINEWNVSLRYSANENRVTASIDGTITGLCVRDNNTRQFISSKWTNAEAKWLNYVFPYLFTTVQGAVGPSTPLNPVEVNRSLAMNEISGTITYHWEYDNRPTTVTPGAISETVTVTNSNAADSFATIPVLGRPYGPVLQGLGTVTAKKRTISIDILMPPTTIGYASSSPNTAPLVLVLAPFSSIAVFLESDEESWTPNTGRYTRHTVFVWE